MKSLKFGLVVLFSVISIVVRAEKLSLCYALNKIIESSDKEFSDIKLSEFKGNSYGKTYKTSVEISEATDCYLEGLIGPLTYNAKFGEFNSEESAKSKVAEYTRQLKSCFNMIDFVEYEDGLLKNRNIDFIIRADKGYRYFKAGFRIKKYGSDYDLVFEFKAPESFGFGDNKKLVPVYSDCYYIDKQPDNTQLSIDIRKLIDEGRSGFSNIKGDEFTSDFYLFKNYKAKFTPSGFSGCFIEDRGLNVIFYIIPLKSDMNQDETVKLRNDYFAKIQSTLGSDYVYSLSVDQYVLSFAKKLQPQKTILKLVAEFKSGTYSLSLQVAANM